MRKIILSLIVSLISTPVWACSCGTWEGGLVSDFVENYTSFWGVPVSSRVQTTSIDRPKLIAAHRIEVLEDYNQILEGNIEVISSIYDGVSCGIEVPLGVPQFLSVYKYDIETYAANSCTPYLPYTAIKDYLETGKDAFIPPQYSCFNEDNQFNLENPDCIVWRGSEKYQWGQGSDIDQLKYLKLWRLKNYTPQP